MTASRAAGDGKLDGEWREAPSSSCDHEAAVLQEQKRTRVHRRHKTALQALLERSNTLQETQEAAAIYATGSTAAVPKEWTQSSGIDGDELMIVVVVLEKSQGCHRRGK